MHAINWSLTRHPPSAELLAIQNAIQDKEVKALLERSISTISGNSGDKS